MIILQDSQVKKLFYKEQEIDKILDWNGNVVFEKESAPTMTNDIKFTTNSRVGTAYHIAHYTDSTSDSIKSTEPNKLYVLPIPTGKTVQQLETYNYYLDEVAVSCKIKLSNCFITQPPKTIRLLDCDSTSSTSLESAFKINESVCKLVEIRNLDAKNATSMASMFADSTHLETIVMNGVDVSKVTDMNGMFSGCTNATTIDITNWNTSSVTNLSHAFYKCNKVASIDLSSWDVSKVTDMRYMFGSCENLASLDVSHFNTSNVTNMSGMFSRCPYLESLDLSGWNTAKVTDMSNMFMVCQAKSLDLSGWDMTSVETTNMMFFRCNSLKTIKMIGCNQTTIDKIKKALSSASILNQVTIVTS